MPVPKIKIYWNGQLLTDIASTSYSVFTVGTNDLPALNQSGHTFYISNHVSSYYYGSECRCCQIKGVNQDQKKSVLKILL